MNDHGSCFFLGPVNLGRHTLEILMVPAAFILQGSPLHPPTSSEWGYDPTYEGYNML